MRAKSSKQRCPALCILWLELLCSCRVGGWPGHLTASGSRYDFPEVDHEGRQTCRCRVKDCWNTAKYDTATLQAKQEIRRRTNSAPVLKSRAQIQPKVDNVSSDVIGLEQTLDSKLKCASKMHCGMKIVKHTQQSWYRISFNICSKSNWDPCLEWFYDDVICMKFHFQYVEQKYASINP